MANQEQLNQAIDEAAAMAALGEATIGDVMGLTQQNLDTLYAMAYQFYTSGQYEKAEKVFRALCLYCNLKPVYWMGLGAALQGLKRYQEAASAYSAACTMSGLNDPEPMYYAAQCFLKAGRKEDAMMALDSTSIMGRKDHPRDEEIKQRCLQLLEALRADPVKGDKA